MVPPRFGISTEPFLRAAMSDNPRERSVIQLTGPVPTVSGPTPCGSPRKRGPWPATGCGAVRRRARATARGSVLREPVGSATVPLAVTVKFPRTPTRIESAVRVDVIPQPHAAASPSGRRSTPSRHSESACVESLSVVAVSQLTRPVASLAVQRVAQLSSIPGTLRLTASVSQPRNPGFYQSAAKPVESLSCCVRLPLVHLVPTGKGLGTPQALVTVFWFFAQPQLADILGTLFDRAGPQTGCRPLPVGLDRS